ncbi:hypothetical protein B0H17DRAFT_1137223 [Mycena rosella]|uniref:F-box domain-containing protein n=1 Tax=Mycena rosella TaxID=1033263 RepID=A0AAD7GB52_MYCRO|nr:hypothetical protein B0H17DRAFT_1137223 [Mycena rosella]
MTATSTSTALQIQELADLCIEHLCDSPSDLKVCAMVSRSWASAAQSHLFRKISVASNRCGSNHDWSHLLRTLRRSPHLTRHIRHLHINMQAFSGSPICELRFTGLYYVSIRDPCTGPGPFRVGIQQLLRLPTLGRVKIAGKFAGPSDFLEMWHGCSPSIAHVELLCIGFSLLHTLPISADPSTRPILKSLGIRSALTNIRPWLRPDVCPLDISYLKVLSIADGYEMLRWPEFASVLQTIEVLDLMIIIPPDAHVQHSSPTINLSALPHLGFIRMSVAGGLHRDGWQIILDALSTITTPSSIRTIVIHSGSYLDVGGCNQLESHVLSLPVHPLPIVEFEMAAIKSMTASNVHEYFPTMASKSLVRVIPRGGNRFEVQGGHWFWGDGR